MDDTMHFEDRGPKPPVASVPPSVPQHSATATGSSGRSAWPTVLGIVATVFGAIGFLNGAMSVVATLFLDSFLSSLPTPPNPNPAAMAVIEALRSAGSDWTGVLMLTQLARAVVPVVLLVGGILLLQRKRSSMSTLRIWAILQAIALPVRVAAGYLILRQALLQMPGAAVIPVILGFAVLFGLALPVFTLIWFGRARIREEVQTWS